MKYKITKFEEDKANITVIFDDKHEHILELPIDSNGLIPEGKELNAFINNHAPTYIEERNKKIAGMKNASSIKPLIQEVFIDDDNEVNYVNNFNIELLNKRKQILKTRQHKISMIQGTTFDNLVDHEMHQNRLLGSVHCMLSRPEEWIGVMFNGEPLPDNRDGIMQFACDFIDEYQSRHEAIETIIINFNEAMDKLSKSRTMEDLKNIKW